jgi:hypothetical protein
VELPAATDEEKGEASAPLEEERSAAGGTASAASGKAAVRLSAQASQAASPTEQ